jgi:hypothetical protein
LDAVTVSVYKPVVAGFPLNVALPFPLSVKVSPAGSAGEERKLKPGVAGNPETVKIKELFTPVENVALLVLVNVGASGELATKR